MNDAYPLKPFRVDDRQNMLDILRTYPLGTLITGAAGACRMTLVPMLIDDEATDIYLTGHVDRNNAQVEDLVVGSPVSFHFVGPDSYASPDLYPDAQLPGWLYVSAQGDGEVCEVLDAADLRASLVRATDEFGAADQRFALRPDDPRVGDFLPYIHGFRIRITRLSGIAKLAQDKGKVDSDIAVDHLATQDNASSRMLFERLAATAKTP